MHIRFQTPYQYLFYHHHIKHLLLLWEKERKKEIYIVEEENDAEPCLILRYPGETYTEVLLDELGDVFFQELESEGETFQAILGATFWFQKKLIGMYYHQEHPTEKIYFFEIKDKQIMDIPDTEYVQVVKTFAQEYPEHIEQKTP